MTIQKKYNIPLAQLLTNLSLPPITPQQRIDWQLQRIHEELELMIEECIAEKMNRADLESTDRCNSSPGED